MKAVDMNQPEMRPVREQDVAALLNPRPAVLVTCGIAGETPNVLSVAWHTPLSHDPPLVGVSIHPHRHSYSLIASNHEFGINVMPFESRVEVEFCGNHSGSDLDKFRAANLELNPAHQIHVPMLKAALAHLECSVVDELQTGDHTFFVGRVLYAEARADQFQHGYDLESSHVLLCMQRDQFGVFHGQP